MRQLTKCNFNATGERRGAPSAEGAPRSEWCPGFSAALVRRTRIDSPFFKGCTVSEGVKFPESSTQSTSVTRVTQNSFTAGGNCWWSCLAQARNNTAAKYAIKAFPDSLDLCKLSFLSSECLQIPKHLT